MTEKATAFRSLGLSWPGSENGHSYHPVLMSSVRGALPLVTPTRFYVEVHSKAEGHLSLSISPTFS
jgi:hypothetical protein